MTAGRDLERAEGLLASEGPAAPSVDLTDRIMGTIAAGAEAPADGSRGWVELWIRVAWPVAAAGAAAAVALAVAAPTRTPPPDPVGAIMASPDFHPRHLLPLGPKGTPDAP